MREERRVRRRIDEKGRTREEGRRKWRRGVGEMEEKRWRELEKEEVKEC